MKTISKMLVGGAAVTAVLSAYEFIFKPQMFSWGATAEECSRSWPGDEFTPRTSGVCTRAITINATPEDIWPWIMQIGQDRAGFYSYTWLENLFRAEMNNTFKLVPEWQHRQVGDDLWMAAQHHYRGMARMTIARIEPYRALVNVPYPDRDSALNVQWAPHGSWNFILQPVPGDEQLKPSTRLIMRSVRPESMSLSACAASLFWDPAHFIMERKMMYTIKRLAEKKASLAHQEWNDEIEATITRLP
jgi:hypothetical protein